MYTRQGARRHVTNACVLCLFRVVFIGCIGGHTPHPHTHIERAPPAPLRATPHCCARCNAGESGSDMDNCPSSPPSCAIDRPPEISSGRHSSAAWLLRRAARSPQLDRRRTFTTDPRPRTPHRRLYPQRPDPAAPPKPPRLRVSAWTLAAWRGCASQGGPWVPAP